MRVILGLAPVRKGYHFRAITPVHFSSLYSHKRGERRGIPRRTGFRQLLRFAASLLKSGSVMPTEFAEMGEVHHLAGAPATLAGIKGPAFLSNQWLSLRFRPPPRW